MGIFTDVADQFTNRFNKEVDKYFDRGADKIIQKINEYQGDEYTTPAVKNIDEFRSNISNEGGLQRTNQFRLNISIPKFLTDSIDLGSFSELTGMSAYNNTLSLLCKSIEVPAKTLNTTEIKINGQRRVVPANYTWDNITITFIDTNSCVVYNTIYDWMDSINNPATNTGRFYDDYISELKIDYLDKRNDVLGYIRLVDAFPISLSRSSLSYDNQNEVMTTKVTFTYTYQSNQDYSAKMLYNIISNLTNGSVGNLIDKAKSVVKSYNPAMIIRDSLKSKNRQDIKQGSLYLFTKPKNNQ